jgi:hypothetical protein
VSKGFLFFSHSGGYIMHGSNVVYDDIGGVVPDLQGEKILGMVAK